MYFATCSWPVVSSNQESTAISRPHPDTRGGTILNNEQQPSCPSLHASACMPQPASACLSLPQPASACLSLPYPSLPTPACPALPQPALPQPALPQPASACLSLPSLTMTLTLTSDSEPSLYHATCVQTGLTKWTPTTNCVAPWASPSTWNWTEQCQPTRRRSWWQYIKVVRTMWSSSAAARRMEPSKASSTVSSIPLSKHFRTPSVDHLEHMTPYSYMHF